jgi:hypothetical protein
MCRFRWEKRGNKCEESSSQQSAVSLQLDELRLRLIWVPHFSRALCEKWGRPKYPKYQIPQIPKYHRFLKTLLRCDSLSPYLMTAVL